MRWPLAGHAITSQSLAPGATSATYVTTLPSNPVDGQEIYYAADAGNSVIWHLRYRAAGGTYKWEYVGGSQMIAKDQSQRTAASVANGTFTSTPTALNITAPLTGDYIASGGCTAYTNNGSNTNVGLYMGFKVGSTTPTVWGEGQQTTQNFVGIALTERYTVSSLASNGGVFEMQIAQYSGATRNVYRQYAFMTLLPVCVG